jgi:hypothetical protein
MKLDPVPRRVTPAPVTSQQIAAAVAGLAGRLPTPHQPLRTLENLPGGLGGHPAGNGQAKPEAPREAKPEAPREAQPAPGLEPTLDPTHDRPEAQADAKAEPKPDPKADAKARLRRSSPGLTPTSAFDAIESDFFAREADLYKKETVDSFDDLERGTDPRLRQPARSQPQNARKKR